MPPKRLQPRAYHAFRCLGADCEDTCCTGWLVNIDKGTYDRYQSCQDPDLGPRLRELISINPVSTHDDSYARIVLSGTSCPFLDDGLCGIQNKLGESYLATLCARFPRTMVVVDDVLERSLDLACPEAARLMLLDPAPIQFDEEQGQPYDRPLGVLSEANTSDAAYRYFAEIRGFVIGLLQYRAYPLWKRLVILGAFCDQLEQLGSSGQSVQVPACVRWFRNAVQQNTLDSTIQGSRPQPVTQLGIVLELIVARITGDYTSPRFLQCYQDFKDGIQWTSGSSMEEIGGRYAEAYAQYFAPFLGQHEHMLEHYLVNYVYRTLFPLGPQKSHLDPSEHQPLGSIRERFHLMMVYYAVVQTVSIGLAALRREEFGPADMIRVVQATTKSIEHSLSFPRRALEILSGKQVKNCMSLAVLLRN